MLTRDAVIAEVELAVWVSSNSVRLGREQPESNGLLSLANDSYRLRAWARRNLLLTWNPILDVLRRPHRPVPRGPFPVVESNRWFVLRRHPTLRSHEYQD